MTGSSDQMLAANPAEISPVNVLAKYTNIKMGGGDTGAPLNLNKRINLIKRYIKVEQAEILDCGCGSGDYVNALHQLEVTAYGLEYNLSMVTKGKKRNPSLRLSSGDIQRIPFPNHRFDVVLLNEVLEHIPNEMMGLKEIQRILKPGGHLIVFSPNRLYPIETHGVYPKGSDKLLPYSLPFIPYIPLSLGKRIFRYWARNYWPHELRKVVTQCGFKIIDFGFIWPTFENISGKQPLIVSKMRNTLRTMSTLLETIPGINRFGVSQMIIAVKLPETQ